MSKRSLQCLAVLGLLGVLVGACSNGSTSSEGKNSTGTTRVVPTDTGLYPKSALNKPQHTGTPRRGGSMTFGLESTVLNYSPNQSVIQPSDLQVETSVFDSLTTYNEKGLVVLDNAKHRYNQLADSIKPDGSNFASWTLKLRPGIKFSNGVPLTAQQVVDHTNWIKDSGTCSCDLDAQNIADITAVDDLTVHYTLKSANVAWPTKLANSGIGWITESGARGSAPKPTIKQLVGTGAFSFGTENNGVFTVLANRNYYGTDAANGNAKLPYLDKITFLPLANTNTRLSAVHSNGVQIMQTADTSNLVGAKRDPDLTVQPISGSSSTILVLRLTSTPFGVNPKPGETPQQTAIRGLNDPTAQKARTAFATSINRNEINQKYYRGARVPAYGFIPDDSPYFDPKGQLPHFDAATSKAMVASLEKAPGAKPLNVKSMCIPGPEASSIFQILQQQGNAVGIHSTLSTVEQSVLVSSLLLGQETSATQGWNVSCFRSAQLADPDGVYSGLYTGGPANILKFSDPKVDQALDKGRTVFGVAARKPYYDIVQERVAHASAIIPLLFDYYGNVYRNNVSGLGQPQANALGLIPLAGLYYKK